MAEGGLFSSDLPLSRGGESTNSNSNGDPQADHYDSRSHDSDSDGRSSNTNTLRERNISENNQSFIEERRERVSNTRNKPLITDWLTLFTKVPNQVITDEIDKYDLDRDNEELSWLKLYDYLSIDKLNQMVDLFATKRSINIDLSDQTIDDPIIDLSEQENNSRITENTPINERNVRFA